MNLPIRFPDPADETAGEAARFRALPPEARVRALGESFREYWFLRTISGRGPHIDRFAGDEERRGWESIREFAARHGIGAD